METNTKYYKKEEYDTPQSNNSSIFSNVHYNQNVLINNQNNINNININQQQNYNLLQPPPYPPFYLDNSSQQSFSSNSSSINYYNPTNEYKPPPQDLFNDNYSVYSSSNSSEFEFNSLQASVPANHSMQSLPLPHVVPMSGNHGLLPLPLPNVLQSNLLQQQHHHHPHQNSNNYEKYDTFINPEFVFNDESNFKEYLNFDDNLNGGINSNPVQLNTSNLQNLQNNNLQNSTKIKEEDYDSDTTIPGSTTSQELKPPNLNLNYKYQIYQSQNDSIDSFQSVNSIKSLSHPPHASPKYTLSHNSSSPCLLNSPNVVNTNSPTATPSDKKLILKPLPNRKRIATLPRSKNGCWVCRIRHLKCDEQKPNCCNCSRLNISCDYSSAKPDYVVDKNLKNVKLKEISSTWKNRFKKK